MKKKLTWLLVCLFVLFASVVVAEPKMCGSPTGPAMPPGTKAVAAGEGTLNLVAPKGWYFFVNQNGKWSPSPSAVLRCSCESGAGGCHPTLLPNGQAFCAMDTCSTCNKSGALRIYPVQESLEGVTFASKEEVARLPRANGELLSIPDVQKDIKLFKESLGIPLESHGKQSVFIRIYGYTAPMEWPDNTPIRMSENKVLNMAAGLAAMSAAVTPTAAVSCSCESGGSCKLESNFGVKVCHSYSCATCAMHY